jgi:hypothetical protein
MTHDRNAKAVGTIAQKYADAASANNQPLMDVIERELLIALETLIDKDVTAAERKKV